MSNAHTETASVKAAAPRSTESIILAFEQDGFEVTDMVTYHGARGFLARSRTATNYETGERKPAYYVEGTGYQMGYLMGLLAPQVVERMANDYVYNFIPCMLNPNGDPEKYRMLWKLIWSFITLRTRKLRNKYPKDVPEIYVAEMKGLVDGCKKATHGTSTVTLDKLWNLNTAFDLILALVYTNFGFSNFLRFLKKRFTGFQRSMLVMPAFCNGFSVFGEGTSSGDDHFFGREFMLSTGNTLEFTASMIICHPFDKYHHRSPQPFVTMSAPGFTGSLTAMNSCQLGLGVNTIPAANCRPSRPGLNSILMVRHCAQYATSASDVVDMMAESQRGVAWLYIAADGRNDKAVVVEAGRKEAQVDGLQYPSYGLHKLLPGEDFLRRHPHPVPEREGLMQRWNDYEYPAAYFRFNEHLFRYYKKSYNAGWFSEDGMIDKDLKEDNCPRTFYFAPQRESKKDMILVTNMYLIPEMRLCMMSPATVRKANAPQAIKIAKTTYDDIQWRYDALNKTLLDAYGSIDFDKAQEIIDFLNPNGRYPEYSSKHPTSSDGKVRTIQGTISVCDLKALVMKSQYGYYTDEWVWITLPDYI